MKIRNWNPNDGDALQGDVILFRVPDSLVIDTTDEIRPRDSKLILAEGEVTGHHHAIWLRSPPAMFREDGAGSGVPADAAAKMVTKATTKRAAAVAAHLYRDPAAVAALVRAGELTTDTLAIGFLIVGKAPVILRHDEHDAIRIPGGTRCYVGGQREWDVASERRVAD